ncbi:MAG TPA: hypothetical protein VJ962_06500 [Clostridia bacterium]|nr:hypothetical protein [Clostridia bacterium]
MDVSKNVLERLISRYDYGGVYEALEEYELKDTDLAILANSTRYAVNFDFKTSSRILYDLSDELEENYLVKDLKNNLQDLIDGQPDELFSELLDNIRFQIKNEEYIDFLGRVYRFREAIFKYIFVRKSINRKSFSLHNRAMEKRNILRILRKKYHINNGNLVYAIVDYIKKHCKDDYKINEVSKTLTNEKLNNLIELRNSSIVGHGFIGASIDDVYSVYGNPENVLEDFVECLNQLGFVTSNDKYRKLNHLMCELLKEL